MGGMASERHDPGLIVERRGHIRTLTLDRPERRNALSTALQADLVEELLRCAEEGLRNAAAHAPYAPTPGSTIRSAFATTSASAVTIRSLQPAVRSAFSTEWRLPAP